MMAFLLSRADQIRPQSRRHSCMDNPKQHWYHIRHTNQWNIHTCLRANIFKTRIHWHYVQFSYVECSSPRVPGTSSSTSYRCRTFTCLALKLCLRLRVPGMVCSPIRYHGTATATGTATVLVLVLVPGKGYNICRRNATRLHK